MSILVLGGTGTVGSAVVRELLDRGEEEIRVVTRSADKAAALPKGVKGVVADLTDPTTLEGVFEGAERVFLLNPVAMTELHEGLTALSAARQAGVGKIVYLSVHNPEAGAHIPHFAAKVAVERALRESEVAHVILQPSSFFQNDLWLRDAMLDYGVYPQPLGEPGVSRVDVRDIAVAAAHALTSSTFDGRAVPLVGPDVLTGEACARAWSEALARGLQYGGDDLAAWERQNRAFMPAWMAYDFRLMFAMFHEGALLGTEADLEHTREILGREPRSFHTFTRECAVQWGVGGR